MSFTKYINKIFIALNGEYSNAKSALHYNSPYQLLIAVLLSAQATDISVNKATETLFEVAPTPEKMLLLGEKQLKEFIHTIGLYNAKAKNIIALSKILIEQFNAQIPQKRDELESLPGVGRKTANVVLNVVFNQPTIAVDTHIFRLANRTKIAVGKTPLEVEKTLLEITPKKYLRKAHHLLLWHGRLVCKARKPECSKCCIKQYCKYTKKEV